MLYQPYLCYNMVVAADAPFTNQWMRESNPCETTLGPQSAGGCFEHLQVDVELLSMAQTECFSSNLFSLLMCTG